jgi:hypothetical protein
MIDIEKARLDAVDAIIAADGWCEKLPSSNCKHCPILCFVANNNEDLLRKAKKYLSSQAVDNASDTGRDTDAPLDFPAH